MSVTGTCTFTQNVAAWCSLCSSGKAELLWTAWPSCRSRSSWLGGGGWSPFRRTANWGQLEIGIGEEGKCGRGSLAVVHSHHCSVCFSLVLRWSSGPFLAKCFQQLLDGFQFWIQTSLLPILFHCGNDLNICTRLTCRNDFKFFQGSWINRFITNVDTGTAYSSRERHSFSPTQSQENKAENKNCTLVHGSESGGASVVVGSGCFYAVESFRKRGASMHYLFAKALSLPDRKSVV